MNADWKTVWTAILGIAALGSFSGWVAAEESPFVGSQTCNSVSCHGRSEPRRDSLGIGGASLQEFLLYSRRDPHAAAAKRLVSPEFLSILRRLTEAKGGPSAAEVYQQCAQCHDPEGMAAAANAKEPLLPLEVGHGISARGIQCESCHGGAKDWLATHSQRDLSRSLLSTAGMRDTKKLQVRAELCASCHVGSAEKNVTHDMLAAGHPPLRFELAAYHRKLTSHDSSGKQSHWNDARERIDTKDFEVKLWEAGQIASAAASLTLLEGRAHRAALDEKERMGVSFAPWPEFAEYDCFRCHQRLQPVSENGKTTETSRSEWVGWNLSLVAALTDSRELKALRAEMKKSFASEPSRVAEQAAAARKSLLPNLFTERATSSQLLTLLERPAERSYSWETLCQRYLALRAAQKSIGDEFLKLELAGRVGADRRTAFNAQRERIDRDLTEIARSLSFANTASEWPRILMDRDGIMKVESDLTTAAGKLHELHSYSQVGR